jgi:Ca-activated chloride channel family protein
VRFRPFVTALLLASALFAQDSKDQTTTFKVDVKLVNVFATVTDKNGAPITDLKKEDFVLKEDGSAESIAVFAQESELPLSIVLAIDASGSVKKDLPGEMEAARRFVDSMLRPIDKVAVFKFAEVVSEMSGFTSRMKIIEGALKRIRVGSGTALFDAIYLGSERLMDRTGRKVIVVISDGGDTMSRVSYKEAVRAAQQSEAIVYSVIIVPVAASAGRNTGGENALIQLSKDTGGKHYYADSALSLDEAFQQISKELRTQYLIGYYPTRRVADSDFRRIQVAIAPKSEQDEPEERFRVRHRTGYYTSKFN